MRLRATAGCILAVGALSSLGCAGEMVAEQTVPANGELTWNTKLPADGKPSLWAYFDLSSPAGRTPGPKSKMEPAYALTGTLAVTSGGKSIYTGPFRIQTRTAPLTSGGVHKTSGSSQSCSNSGCSLSTKLFLTDIEGLPPGAPLEVHVTMPMQQGSTTLRTLKMQLRK